MSLSNEDWSPLRNPFDYPTRSSYTLLEILLRDHVSKVRRDRFNNPEIGSIYNVLNAKAEEFYDSFVDVRTKVNLYRDATALVKDEFNRLFTPPDSLLDNWEARIVVVYPRHSNEYKNMLFPHGRKPFRTGGHEERARAIKTLITTFANFSNLNSVMDALRQEMLAFWQGWTNLRDAQQQMEGQLATARRTLQKHRLIVIEQMDYDLHRLISIYRGEKERVLEYYQVDLIRTTSSSSDIPSDDITPETDDENTPPNEGE